jgi:hypothetical protein
MHCWSLVAARSWHNCPNKDLSDTALLTVWGLHNRGANVPSLHQEAKRKCCMEHLLSWRSLWKVSNFGFSRFMAYDILSVCIDICSSYQSLHRRYTAASKKRKGYCRPTTVSFPLGISKYFTSGVSNSVILRPPKFIHTLTRPPFLPVSTKCSYRYCCTSLSGCTVTQGI